MHAANLPSGKNMHKLRGQGGRRESLKDAVYLYANVMLPLLLEITRQESFNGMLVCHYPFPSQTQAWLASTKRFRHSRRKRRSRQRRKAEEEEATQYPTHGVNGRLIMTEKLWKQCASQDITAHNAKNILHNAQQKLRIRSEISHDAKGLEHALIFYTQIRISIPKSLLPVLPQYPDSSSSTRSDDNHDNDDNDRIHLMATGAARRKSQAEVLATVDMIHQFRECGLDPRNPPDVCALEKQQARELHKQRLQRAQMLLELCHVSRPQFTTETLQYTNTSYAEVSMLYRNEAITAMAEGNSRVEAEGKALIAAAGEPVEHVVGKEHTRRLEALITNSPAGHVASPVPSRRYH
jgi:hypothetical protein